MHGEWSESVKTKFDLIGSILFSIALSLIMYGFSKLPEAIGVWALLIGIVSLIIFIWWEGKALYPVLDIKLFTHNTVFAMSNTAALLNYSTTSAVTFLLSFYLQYVKGLDPKAAGLILVAQPIFMMLVSPLAGRLSDKVEPRIIASVGMMMTVIGLGLFIPIQSDSSEIYIVVNLVILGIGFGLFSSPNTNAVMSSVGKEVYGVATATLGTMRLTGQMLSMGIVMLIFSTSMGRIKITSEFYPQFIISLRIAFAIFGSLCFFGIFASLSRGKVR